MLIVTTDLGTFHQCFLTFSYQSQHTIATRLNHIDLAAQMVRFKPEISFVLQNVSGCFQYFPVETEQEASCETDERRCCQMVAVAKKKYTSEGAIREVVFSFPRFLLLLSKRKCVFAAAECFSI